MNALNFDTLYTPLYVAGLVSSAVLLAILRQREIVAAKAELVPQFDPGRQIYVCRKSLRVRLGVEPILNFGRANTVRFLSPSFLFGEVLPREPLSVIPFTLAWLFLLADGPGWCAIAVIFGVSWRALVDALTLPKAWSADERIETVKLKLAWCILSGVWGASLVVFGAAMLVGLILVFAMCAAGATKSRRSKW
jgi:hypothetical protein